MERIELHIDSKLFYKSMEVLGEQVGVTEKTGHNDGPMIKKYLASVGLGIGYPYCAAGQYYSFSEACDRLGMDYDMIPIERTAMALGIFYNAKAIGKETPYEPQFGDLLFWKKSNNINGHIERIIEVIDEFTVKTIGFNTSNGKVGKQREGDGVFVRERSTIGMLGNMKVAGLVGFKFKNNYRKITSAEIESYKTPAELLESISKYYSKS